jgi:hypothetical protein
MRNHSRARRFALTALCAGGTIGAAGLAAAPSQALAATCSNVYGSGSTLQTLIQQSALTPGFTDPNCSPSPSVYYNTNAAGMDEGGSGSGAGLTEFALQPAVVGGSVAITPSKSENGSFLDGFIGTDDPPNASALSGAAAAADSDPETVPVFQAPIAIIVHLPAGCTIKASPVFTNVTLSAAFANTSTDNISWTKLLGQAKAEPSGCPTTSPTVQVRYDGSGTTYATKQYFDQIDPTTWNGFVSDGTTGDTQASWPGTVQTTYSGGNDQGSSGEAAAVAATKGSVGYVNTQDASKAGFKAWAAGTSKFWVKIQNNGTSTSGSITGADPVSSSNVSKCTTSFSGTIPHGNEPDWSTVHVARPKQPLSSDYPLCTLTYNVAWQTYINSSVLAPDYTSEYSGETPAGVEQTTRDYLAYELGTGSGQGQTLIPDFYSPLPSQIDTDAASIVSADVGTN